PTSVVTREGTVMGTPDYIAPEQALESHTADVRADLYSLGCTFYHLLTGRAPFPGGSLMEKLLKHRLEEPKPLELCRPDVPAGVAGVVRRLMAKSPEDRYQTPAELVEALEQALGSSGGEDHTLVRAGPSDTVSETLGDTFSSPFAHLSGEAGKPPHQSHPTRV